MKKLLPNGEKITPEQWRKELKSLSEHIKTLNAEVLSLSNELAMSEVIDYNRIDLQRFEGQKRAGERKQAELKEKIQSEVEKEYNTVHARKHIRDDR